VDLNSFSVTGTIKTGNGPAGISLSNDGRYLYVVNSYSNDISIFDLETEEEINRTSAGIIPQAYKFLRREDYLCNKQTCTDRSLWNAGDHGAYKTEYCNKKSHGTQEY